MAVTAVEDTRRARRALLGIAGVLVAIGVIAAGVWSDDTEPAATASIAQRTTSTTDGAEVLGVQVDNTTVSTAVPAVSPLTVAPSTSTTTAKHGRIYGYSYPSEPNDKTTVTLSRAGAVVAEKQTDAEGYFEFRDVPAGTAQLHRTPLSSNCPTTTVPDDKPKCTMASSQSEQTEVALAPSGDVRADVF
jgi:hypothetical protein